MLIVDLLIFVPYVGTSSKIAQGDAQMNKVRKHAFFGLDVKSILRRSIRMYFAPLVGAFKGMRAEMHRYDVEETAQKPK